jgi:hypothetical protein
MGGNHEPQPAVFFFRELAENYDLFVQTREEMER